MRDSDSNNRTRIARESKITAATTEPQVHFSTQNLRANNLCLRLFEDS